MKQVLPLVIGCLLGLNSNMVSAQVTLLSNNTNLTTGVVVNGKAFLIAETDSLWTTDGTAAGTVKFTNKVADDDTTNATFLNSKIYFGGVDPVNGAELWASDGSEAGTVLIKDIRPGSSSSYPDNLVTYNNIMLFNANNGTNGKELWVSDGTTAGTSLLKDIYPGPTGGFDSDGPNFYMNNNIVYFIANDGTNGVELWKTDGTAAGTVMIKDITPGIANTRFTMMISLGNSVIFGVIGGTLYNPTFQVWTTDGTTANTTLLRDFGTMSGYFPTSFYRYNNKIYFAAYETATGDELWSTDGSVAGTVLVKDIETGSESSMPQMYNAAVVNNHFLFPVTTQTNGTEIWTTDGTAAGTVLFKDINPAGGSSDPIFFRDLNYMASQDYYTNNLYQGRLFFSADDGTHGTELWWTDGTAAGTNMVKDIWPGSDSALSNNSFLGYFYTTSGLYFTANNGVSGEEIWLSDGTAAGTNLVADVNPGIGNADPEFLFIYNNQLYFNATNGDSPSNTDLFKINGTVISLPLKLLNFSATATPDKAVTLNWTTTNETNGSHFEIERSVDGKRFTNVGTVNMNNTPNRQQYSFNDLSNQALNEGVVYYRLKMVDKDGSISYSPVVPVHFNSRNVSLTYAPNPVKDQLNVTIRSNNSKQATLRIYDAGGKQVYQRVINNSTSSVENINTSAWANGIYSIEVIINNERLTGRFIKQ